MKNRYAYLTILILLIVSYLLGGFYQKMSQSTNADVKETMYNGQVQEMSLTTNEFNEKIMNVKVWLEVDQGISITISDSLSNLSEHILPLYPGDTVVVAQTDTHYHLVSPNRSNSILIFVVFAFIILLVVMLRQGVKTLFAFFATAFILYFYFIPGVFAAINPYILLLSTAFFVSSITFLSIDGFSTKSMTALIGSLSGMILISLISFGIISFLRITSPISEDYTYIKYAVQNASLNLPTIFFYSLSIGSFGAIMDITMSIASALHEMTENQPLLERKSLIKSGMSVGRDALSTMIITLVLAYLGSSLPSILLLSIYQRSSLYITNSIWFAAEVAQTVIGVLGMVFSVLITIYTFTWIYAQKRMKYIHDDSV